MGYGGSNYELNLFPQGGGLDTMVLSPDEELLLLMTPEPKAILMTREFDPIAEVDVDASQDDDNQVSAQFPKPFTSP